MTDKCLYNVLIFPCGSMIGLELHKQLNFSSQFKLFGGTSVVDHGSYVYENLISNLPFITDDTFLDSLNEFIQEYEIDFIFPTSDQGMLLFSSWQEKGLIKNAHVLVSPYETCRIAYSKMEIFQKFQGILPLPKLYRKESDIVEYPVFLKPDIGTGGIGTHIANSPEEVTRLLRNDSSLLIMKYLDGSDFAVDCFTDRFGKLRFAQGRVKSRYYFNSPLSRYMGHMEEIIDSRLISFAEKINNALDLIGPWFVQIRANAENELFLIEFGARIEGGTSFNWVNGVNLPMLALYDALGMEFEIIRNDYGLKMDRTLWHYRYKITSEFNIVYLNFEDSLFLHGKINYKLVSLLYKFKSEGKKIQLFFDSNTITKNGLSGKLLSNHVSISLFDNLIKLNESRRIEALPISKDSVLIDSSINNRSIIAANFDIPVLDIGQAIEIFLN